MFSYFCQLIDDARNKKLEYAIFLGKKFQVRHMSKLYAEIMSQLFELEPNTFFNSNLGNKINLVSVEREKDLRASAKINDDYCVETNINNNEKLNRIKLALELLKLEDELFIKYSPSFDDNNED